ncbi:hypothetical protein LZG74_11275 [Dyadobacter sp. CY327]|uniref:hypothetical protein n=1 Tax=Dyadobacter sp. CY327 TaxID=2907301 RepID=UPI001F2BA556|nr:hypothetical protein [Dyadobacter sp. CY327]MCE7070888.1 hypothetical protein [Dyadobacter sp. CY327]
MAKSRRKAKKEASRIARLSGSMAKKIYVRHSSRLFHRFVTSASGATDNFEYTFTLSSVTILSVDINGTPVAPIKTSGKIFADTGKPFYIDIKASIIGPTPTGTFQLKFIPNGKDVWTTPQELKFETSGNGGLFLPDVKLP